ncbi:hypothetical protein EXIGLDRAFT_837971 [Exidia glandulosa HHB12029]|uniref:BTB domain-containing protein n=1 Tax=Exidia glandulosa HHB12029 TaxID=1314781 RepID=A0A166AAS7_EXIGL|nr:hypothetical protein EXIGLDRAFT_837971 [Exidia glandulosa HHB12029]
MTDVIGPAPMTPERHEALWYGDGNVVLQAENTLYNVHRSVLSRESKLFEDMFALGQQNAQNGEEGTSTSPIPMLDVPAEAFANLLLILYRPWGSKLIASLSDEQFVGILRVAHRLLFEEICTIVADYLVSRLSAERRLELSFTCGLDAWRYAAFEEVVLQMTTNSQHTDTSIAPALWSLVWKARLAVSRHRSATLRYRATLGVVSGCVHVLASLQEFIPYLSRTEFTAKLTDFTLPTPTGGNTRCCAGTRITGLMVVNAYPEILDGEEKRTIREVWEEGRGIPPAQG